MPLLTDELRALVGRTMSYTAPEAFGPAAGRYFARAIGDANPLYTSVEAASAAGLSGPILPPTLIFESNQYADRPADEDGFAGHSWPIELPGARSLRGGNHYVWHRDVVPSDVITATWTITDVAERTTGGGEAMVVITSACRYVDAAGDPIAEQTETLLFVAARG